MNSLMTRMTQQFKVIHAQGLTHVLTQDSQKAAAIPNAVLRSSKSWCDIAPLM